MYPKVPVLYTTDLTINLIGSTISVNYCLRCAADAQAKRLQNGINSHNFRPDFGFNELKGSVSEMAENLSVLAARLRSEGYDCRNLAEVGITIWEEGQGYFYPATELHQNSNLVIRRDFQSIRARREHSSS